MTSENFVKLNNLLNTLNTDCKANFEKFTLCIGYEWWCEIRDYLTSTERESMRENKDVFLHFWNLADKRKKTFETKLESILKSKVYKDAMKEVNTIWSSGYSMGEFAYVDVVIKMGEVEKVFHYAGKDTRCVYRGNAKKYNYKIKYGLKAITLNYVENKRVNVKKDIVEK